MPQHSDDRRRLAAGVLFGLAAMASYLGDQWGYLTVGLAAVAATLLADLLADNGLERCIRWLRERLDR